VKAIKCFFIITLSVVFSTNIFSQNQKNTTDIIKTLEPLSKATKTLDSNLFNSNYVKLMEQTKKYNDKLLYVSLLDKKAIFLYYSDRAKEAIPYYDTAIKIATLHSLDSSLIAFFMNKGAISYSIENYTEALKNYKQSEALMLKRKKADIGGLLVNISLLYREIGDIPSAKNYLQRAIPFIKIANDRKGYSVALNNLGLIYKDEKNFKAADSVYKLGYEYTKTNKEDRFFADVTFNLIVNLLELKKPNEAIKYELELLEHVKKLKDSGSEKLILQTIARTYMELGKMNEVKKYIELSEKITVKEEAVDKDHKNTLLYAADIYLKLKEYKKSALTYKQFYDTRKYDDLQSEFNNVNRLTYSYEKKQDSIKNAKELEIAQLELTHSQETAEYKLQVQRVLLLAALIVLIGILVFAYFLYKSNKSKEKANIEISHQKKLLSEKNIEITDSIKYAKNIQNSLLPSNQTLKNALKDYFLLYIPKDIVSGDFYWIKEISSHEVLIAVADCTGHGVPGAILSALSIQLLNEITEKQQSPDKILKELNLKLKIQLQFQSDYASRDGLDICLCKYNKITNQVIYSGANRNLWVFNKGGILKEIKATKAGIAGHTANEQVFEQHSEVYEKDTFFILSSDGYADQFGGVLNKKITTKHFKNYVSEKSSENLSQIGEHLKEKYLTWKNNSDQIDDVCVIGFKIN